MLDTRTERAEFIEAGYDCIPLRHGEKLPLRQGYQTKPTFSQWHNAPDDSNLGLRAGNGKAFIDCDDKTVLGTTNTVINWLEGLGHKREDLPIVQTASGIGRHVYVNFIGSLLGSRKNLITTFGAGDFRYGPFSYVATFPSVITGMGEYTLLQGDITHLPQIDLRDVAALIDINKINTEEATTRRPSSLAREIISGKIPDKYKGDASTAEAALVLSLINSGYGFSDIKYIFETNPCAGHYENKYKTEKDRNDYLYRTYQNALAHSSQESPTRRMIASLTERVRGSSWDRATDRSALLAHFYFAYRAGSFENYNASTRDLAVKASVSKDTVQAATKRLLKKGMLTVKEAGTRLSATCYGIQTGNLGHILSTPREDVGEVSLPQKTQKYANHDAFRNGGGKYAKGRLGKRAGEIYDLLMGESLTVLQIADRTGADPETVKNALHKMATLKDHKTGEVIEMVTQEEADKTWRANFVDLDLVSAIVQTYGATGRQREQYERERREHYKTLELHTLEAK